MIGVRFAAALAAIQAAAASKGDQPAALRRQALDWLRADLADFQKTPAERMAAVRQELARWRHHVGLAGVRDPRALAGLPAAEKAQWQAFWKEVETLARTKAP